MVDGANAEWKYRETAGQITGADIVNMRSRCWGYDRAIWIANHDTYIPLVSAHITGTNGDRFLFAPGTTLPGTEGNRSLDVPSSLLGRPIFSSEYASKLGDVGDLMLGSWPEYLWGTRQEPRTDSTIAVRFIEYERTFRFTARVDGRVWWRSTLVPQQQDPGGFGTLSPFVVLNTDS